MGQVDDEGALSGYEIDGVGTHFNGAEPPALLCRAAGLRRDHQPEPIGRPLQMQDVEKAEQVCPPPRGGTLDQVGVASVVQHFQRRSGVDAAEAELHDDALQLLEDRLEAFGLDMLEDVDAAHEIGGWGGALVPENGVGGGGSQPPFPPLPPLLLLVALPPPAIRKRARAHLAPLTAHTT